MGESLNLRSTWQRTRKAAVAVALLTTSIPIQANHSWNGYHWATPTGTLDVKINAAITTIWGEYADTAIADWEVSPVLVLGTRFNVAVSRRKCAPIPREILVCNDAYGPRGWLGIASIWLDAKGHITQGTTKLNDTYFSMARYNTAAWRKMVTCQEIGHNFGLAHQDENFSNPNLGSCMDYTNDPTGTAGTNGTKSNEHPNGHDYDQLATIYAHGDNYSSANSSASTNFGIREVGRATPPTTASVPLSDNPADWGRAIHSDSLGRPDIFAKELGAGKKVITHVFWALETKRNDIHLGD